jgi:hypothetical protein
MYCSPMAKTVGIKFCFFTVWQLVSILKRTRECEGGHISEETEPQVLGPFPWSQVAFVRGEDASQRCSSPSLRITGKIQDCYTECTSVH